MKLFLLTFLILNISCFYSQQALKSFEVITKSQNFSSEQKLDALDPFMMDLYRSKTVDNTVHLSIGDQTVSFVLLSANKLDVLGIPYDKGLVVKGALVSGQAAYSPRIFSWKMEENNTIKDLTTY